MPATRNLCAQPPIDLHQRICEAREQSGLTTAQYITNLLLEYYEMKENGGKATIHDKGTGNPHAHIMLTMRPLNADGTWGAKCRKVYNLGEHSQRIPSGKGGWKSHREDTTDWNNRGNAEK